MHTSVVRKNQMIVVEHLSVNIVLVEYGIILLHPLSRDEFSTAECTPKTTEYIIGSDDARRYT